MLRMLYSLDFLKKINLTRLTCFGNHCHCHLKRNAASQSQEKPTYKVEQVWLLVPEQTGPFPAPVQALQVQRQRLPGFKTFYFFVPCQYHVLL